MNVDGETEDGQRRDGEARLYTVQEAAAKLNVPVTWLYEPIRRGPQGK